jgi:predicted GIY-YIG superfamily endonuclease
VSGDRSFWVYILASRVGGTLYIGVTSDLVRRVHEHRSDATGGFTSKHAVHRLVYFEPYSDIESATERMAARLENQVDRGEESELGRPLSCHSRPVRWHLQ